MTNREKYKEIFGYYPSYGECPAPFEFNCDDTNGKAMCKQCRWAGFWDSEYNKDKTKKLLS